MLMTEAPACPADDSLERRLPVPLPTRQFDFWHQLAGERAPGRQPADEPHSPHRATSLHWSFLLLTLNNVMTAVARRHLVSSKVSSFWLVKRFDCF